MVVSKILETIWFIEFLCILIATGSKLNCLVSLNDFYQFFTSPNFKVEINLHNFPMGHFQI